MLRHGQSLANADKNVYFQVKDHLIELSELGKQQAAIAGQEVNKRITNEDGAIVFVSPYVRAKQTWDIMSGYMDEYKIHQIKENPLIREQEYKLFHNAADVALIDKEKADFGPFWYRYKQAESQADAYQRAMIFYLYLQSTKTTQDVIVVAHEIIIKMLMMIIDDIPVDNMQDFRLNNCEIVEREL